MNSHAGSRDALSAAPYENLPPARRTRWILDQRAPRADYDVHVPQSSFTELERSAEGELLSTLTVLLRSRECTWHCLMCDLWKNTVPHPIPAGAIPAQIQHAIDCLPQVPPPPRQIKLYNSGSFFDLRAVPPEDYPAIARLLSRFERVIVECHPKLVGQRALQFRDCLPRTTQLEVAIGLETVHPVALDRLNKGMTVADFSRVAHLLRSHRIDLRAFVLVSPPFVPAAEALEWVRRSVTFAFDCHATAVSLIPVRPGNGAIDSLARAGEFSPPNLATVELALDRSLALARGRVFVDLWDLERFSGCPECLPARRRRLESVNRLQSPQPLTACLKCGHPDHSPPLQSVTAR